MAIINVYDAYSTMADAINAVEAAMRSHFQRMPKETKELVRITEIAGRAADHRPGGRPAIQPVRDYSAFQSHCQAYDIKN